jgi:hypothetical protein
VRGAALLGRHNVQQFDNATGSTTNLGESRAPAMSVDAPTKLSSASSTYIRV